MSASFTASGMATGPGEQWRRRLREGTADGLWSDSAAAPPDCDAAMAKVAALVEQAAVRSRPRRGARHEGVRVEEVSRRRKGAADESSQPERRLVEVDGALASAVRQQTQLLSRTQQLVLELAAARVEGRRSARQERERADDALRELRRASRRRAKKPSTPPRTISPPPTLRSCAQGLWSPPPPVASPASDRVAADAAPILVGWYHCLMDSEAALRQRLTEEEEFRRKAAATGLQSCLRRCRKRMAERQASLVSPRPPSPPRAHVDDAVPHRTPTLLPAPLPPHPVCGQREVAAASQPSPPADTTAPSPPRHPDSLLTVAVASPARCRPLAAAGSPRNPPSPTPLRPYQSLVSPRPAPASPCSRPAPASPRPAPASPCSRPAPASPTPQALVVADGQDVTDGGCGALVAGGREGLDGVAGLMTLLSRREMEIAEKTRVLEAVRFHPPVRAARRHVHRRRRRRRHRTDAEVCTEPMPGSEAEAAAAADATYEESFSGVVAECGEQQREREAARAAECEARGRLERAVVALESELQSEREKLCSVGTECAQLRAELAAEQVRRRAAEAAVAAETRQQADAEAARGSVESALAAERSLLAESTSAQRRLEAEKERLAAELSDSARQRAALAGAVAALEAEASRRDAAEAAERSTRAQAEADRGAAADELRRELAEQSSRAAAEGERRAEAEEKLRQALKGSDALQQALSLAVGEAAELRRAGDAASERQRREEAEADLRQALRTQNERPTARHWRTLRRSGSTGWRPPRSGTQRGPRCCGRRLPWRSGPPALRRSVGRWLRRRRSGRPRRRSCGG
eukprot:TRINITY_DN14645_c0_g2_i1.p1 TRINITY_DN14645_c0_g2~~TRINITY_DN14645_c0_g2_i1.p1  ORF type:complete len:812 (+),score=354.66 TRINITY_DN14645_c0_g2_i1:69-2504(+)